MAGNGKVLIVDDDLNICELLRLYLASQGYDTAFAHDGSTALTLFKDYNPDIVILDVMLPIIGGWDVCRMIRRESDVPIIMLTARDATEDKITGLDAGADDYVVKPFDPPEVVARVRAQLRRKKGSQPSGGQQVVINDLVVDLERYDVRWRGEPIDLKPKEIQLLYFLLTNRNRVFTREQLLDRVWGYDYAGETRTVDVHIKRLREKLEGKAVSWRIATVWGVGYKVEDR